MSLTVEEKERIYRAVIRVLICELQSGYLIKGDPKWARPIADKVMEEDVFNLTVECPNCWLVSDAEQCETCEGEGSLPVYCSRCCQRPAIKHQDGDATCRACEVVAVCQCGEQWCIEELVEAVNTGARTCCREMELGVYGG